MSVEHLFPSGDMPLQQTEGKKNMMLQLLDEDDLWLGGGDAAALDRRAIPLYVM